VETRQTKWRQQDNPSQTHPLKHQFRTKLGLRAFLALFLQKPTKLILGTFITTNDSSISFFTKSKINAAASNQP